MDAKFRKLISRLSLKEKDTNANTSRSAMTVTPCTNNSQTPTKSLHSHPHLQLFEDGLGVGDAAEGGESMKTVTTVAKMPMMDCSVNSNHNHKKTNVIVVDSLGGSGGNTLSESQDHYRQLLGGNNCHIKGEPDDNNNHIYDTVVGVGAREEDRGEEKDKGFCLTKPITMLSIDTQSHLSNGSAAAARKQSADIIYSEPAHPTAGLLTTATKQRQGAFDPSGLDVLTNLQFPCPTLIRKNKKQRPNLNLNGGVNNGGIHVIYEELKPQISAKPRLYAKKGAICVPSQAQALLCNNNEIIGPETHQQKITHDKRHAKGDNNTELEQTALGAEMHAHHETVVVVDVHTVATPEKCDETTTLSTSSEDEEDNNSQSSSSSSSACPSSTTSGLSSTSTESASESPPSSSSSVAAEETCQQTQSQLNENPNKINDGDGDKDNEDSIYVNLQELELSRRQLIAAQVVKAKYAENWIDGQVVEDSILGNKERTKQYWEVRLRKEQDEKVQAAKKKSMSNSVIQKMNAEIEELHRREKELKRMNNLKTSDDEEYEDVYSSNGSSVDEFEPSESPRLESGFYSNAGEDDLTINSPELAKHALKNGENKKATIQVTLQQQDEPSNAAEYNSKEEVEIPKSPNKVTTAGTQDDEVEQEVASSFQTLSGYSDLVTEFAWRLQNFIANYRKETPIEREIRLAREREQEYRMRRSSIASTDSQLQQPVQAAPAVVAPAAVESASPVAKSPLSPPAQSATASFFSTRNSFESRATSNKDAQGKDLQYVLATERLKREILEAKLREEEMKTRTQPKPTLEANTFEGTNGSKASSESDISTQEEVEEIPKPTGRLQTAPVPVHAAPVAAVYRQVEPAIVRQTSVEVAPISPAPSIKSPMTPATPSTYQTFSFLAKNPKFNTLERKYLLKPSMPLRIGTNFQLPKPEEVEAAAQAEEKVKAEKEAAAAKEKEEAENDEPVVPRRRLVSTHQRIAAELREMREREKELELTRKYRSTSDLSFSSPIEDVTPDVPDAPSQHSEDDVFSENGSSVHEEIQEPEFPVTPMARSALGNTISFGPPGRERSGNKVSFATPSAGKARKKSNLVSQWEEKIQNGTDKV